MKQSMDLWTLKMEKVTLQCVQTNWQHAVFQLTSVTHQLQGLQINFVMYLSCHDTCHAFWKAISRIHQTRHAFVNPVRFTVVRLNQESHN